MVSEVKDKKIKLQKIVLQEMEEEMVTETETEVADLDRSIILYIPIFSFLNAERFYCSSFL